MSDNKNKTLEELRAHRHLFTEDMVLQRAQNIDLHNVDERFVFHAGMSEQEMNTRFKEMVRISRENKGKNNE